MNRLISIAAALVVWLALAPSGSTQEFTATQERVIAEIRKRGGEVHVNKTQDGKSELAIRLTAGASDSLYAVSQLPRVFWLDLHDTEVADGSMGRLESLVDLRTLYLDGTRVTDAGLVHLKGLARLEELNLGNNNITGPGLAHLAGLKKLGNLRLHRTKVGNDGLGRLKDATRLTVLDLTETLVTDAGLIHVKDRKDLRELQLGRTKITDAGLEQLKGLTNLESLALQANAVTDAGLVHLRPLRKLNLLNLSSTPVTGTGLAHLKELTQLQALYLARTPVTVQGLGAIKPFAKLEILDLGETSLTDAGLSNVTGLVHLRNLFVDGTRISDAGLVHLRLLGKLKDLNLGSTAVTNAGLDHLQNLATLKMLDLSDTRVSDRGLPKLASLANLREFHHDGAPITQAGIDGLKSKLPGLETRGRPQHRPTQWTSKGMIAAYRHPPEADLSPNGQFAAFNDEDWYLRIVPLAEGRTMRLAWNELIPRRARFSTPPRWSPDGEWLAIAYISDEGAHIARINVARRTDDELARIAVAGTQILEVKWAPDGRSIAFVTVQKKDAPEPAEFIVGEAPFTTAKIFVVPVGAGPGAKERLLVNESHGIFSRHASMFDWAPDSKTIAFTHTSVKRDDDRFNSDISLVDVATGKIEPLAKTGASEVSPRYSPDGKWIAYIGSDDPPTVMRSHAVHIIPAQGGKARKLADTFDRNLLENDGLVGWSPDGKSVYILETFGTTTRLCGLPLDGPPQPIGAPGGVLSRAQLNANRTVATFTWENAYTAPETFVTKLANFHPVRVTNTNAGLADLSLGRTEVIRWKSADKLEIEGLLTYPVGYVQGKRYPMILEIHGGPSAAYRQDYIGAPDACPVAGFAARGYAVLRCNIRGSTGYGQEFRHANRGDFGGKDFTDLMTGVDHVIGLGVADPEQLGVMGWSYGGYMTAVAITKTKRFKAASVGAGVSNLMSYSGRYFGPGLLADYLGPLLDKETLFRERSPIFHIKGVKTPTLIQHGEMDTNVQVEQSYELYHALKAQKSIVQMVVYRQMDHYPGYVELEKIMQRNLEWFDHHVRGIHPQAGAAARVKHVIGHRGSLTDRPENTLASYRRAIEAGATMMEMDVRSTKDGALISLHDADVKRTTNGQGLARDMTLPELRKLDAGSWFDPKFKDERIPTMREILELGKGKIDILLDLQQTGEDYTDEYIARIADEVKKFGEPKRIWLGVRSVENALRFRKLLPEAKQIGLIPTADSIDAFAEAKVDMIRLWPKWLDDKALIPRVRFHKLLLHLNGTVGAEEETLRLLAHEPDSLASDDPGRLVQTLKKIAGK